MNQVKYVTKTKCHFRFHSLVLFLTLFLSLFLSFLSLSSPLRDNLSLFFRQPFSDWFSEMKELSIILLDDKHNKEIFLQNNEFPHTRKKWLLKQNKKHDDIFTNPRVPDLICLVLVVRLHSQGLRHKLMKNTLIFTILKEY